MYGGIGVNVKCYLGESLRKHEGHLKLRGGQGQGLEVVYGKKSGAELQRRSLPQGWEADSSQVTATAGRLDFRNSKEKLEG